MRLPIALALGWPDRMPGAARPVDITRAATWAFFPLDDEAFPAVTLARRVGRAGGTYPGVYNAANEACVAAFLEGRIGFLDIVDTVAAVVADHETEQQEAAERPRHPVGIGDVLDADRWARTRAVEVLASAAAGRNL
jgi:1-deoxy-D-xylulose-5-phosphate reductoisomerase